MTRPHGQRSRSAESERTGPCDEIHHADATHHATPTPGSWREKPEPAESGWATGGFT